MIPEVAAILDPDQGVCPDGHPCHLVWRDEDVVRSCGQPGSRETHTAFPVNTFVGWPLVNPAATQAQIDAARVFDPDLADWAEATVREIVPEDRPPRIPPRIR